MAAEPIKQLKLFYCYAREDKALRDELDNHLSQLKRQHEITSWSDREISPGTVWKKEIDAKLNSADIILLLVSAAFLASDYCYGVEMKRALERHAEGTTRVIPIILRRVYWEGAPFAGLQVLPTDAKPVTQWQDRDEAFWDVTVGISKAIKDLRDLLKTKEEWLNEGNKLSGLKRYEEALVSYEQALRLDPNYPVAWAGKADALYDLNRHEEARSAFEQILRLDFNQALAWYSEHKALWEPKGYKNALLKAARSVFEQILHLSPNYTADENNKMLRLMDQANHSRQQLFISHAVEDNSMALRLKKDLEYHGFQIWLDLDEIAPGVQWDNAIRSAIRESLAILYLASPNSRSSPNVFHEIGMAKIYRCSILPLWIGGTKWADVANFGFYSVQYIDLRSDRYTDGLDRLVQLLRQLQVTHPLDESI